jgi:circadian clock protein KaiB
MEPSAALPDSFKGIALFTPGGDLIYCIDPTKQGRWHLSLCAELQDWLRLSEPPHFLLPCFSATVDRWVEPHTQQVQVFAEATPAVMQYRALLSALFKVDRAHWQLMPVQRELCDPLLLGRYREQFPQLWENHDLVVQMDPADGRWPIGDHRVPQSASEGHVLRLFVAGYTTLTQRILQNLHHLLEEAVEVPYTLEVIDIYKQPEQAEADQITVTPTLLRVSPLPMRRLSGDLDNADRIFRLLGGPGGYGEEY